VFRSFYYALVNLLSIVSSGLVAQQANLDLIINGAQFATGTAVNRTRGCPATQSEAETLKSVYPDRI
jgi:hypothetical protein